MLSMVTFTPASTSVNAESEELGMEFERESVSSRVPNVDDPRKPRELEIMTVPLMPVNMQTKLENTEMKSNVYAYILVLSEEGGPVAVDEEVGLMRETREV